MRATSNKRGSYGGTDYFTTPNLLTPKNTFKNTRTSRANRSLSREDSPKKSLKEKQRELRALMMEEPKRRSSTGYSINDSLRGKWKKLGPLTVDLI
jgi:hypothetical protein